MDYLKLKTFQLGYTKSPSNIQKSTKVIHTILIIIKLYGYCDEDTMGEMHE